MTKSNLTEKVQAFQVSGRNKESLVKEIALYVFSSFLIKNYLTEDQAGDFLCSFYHEIERIIHRFSYQGKPFEAYLNTILKWRIKTFVSRASREKYALRIVNDARFVNTIEQRYLPEDEVLGDRGAQTVKSNLNRADKKRLMLLYMKEYLVADPKYLTHVARITGFPERWIVERAEMLKVMVYKRIKRYKRLLEKRNRTFFKLYLTEKRQLEAYTPKEIQLYASRAKVLSLRLRQTNRELSRFSLRPTHREIAQVTGIPKGTVDSGMFYLKRSFSDTNGDHKKAA